MSTTDHRDPVSFRIHGMDCAEEVAVLKQALGPLVGGEECLSFDALRGKLTVRAEGVAPAAIRDAVADTGMKAETWNDADQAGEGTNRQRRLQRLVTAASGLLTAIGFGVHAWLAGGIGAALGSEGLSVTEGVPVAARACYFAAIVTGGWFIFPKAWFALLRLRPDMNLLMTVAVSGAVGIGEWFEAATVAFLFAVSNALESWSVGRARRAVEALMDLSPTMARVQDADGGEREVPAEDVDVGAQFVVRPGEKVPLDGTVVAGRSEVNQAPITGESVPVAKEAGDLVLAGTINGSGALEARSTRPAGETTLAKMIRLVEEARSRRAPSEQWVERFARVYTPAVMALALLVAVLPPLLAGQSWGTWFYRALVLLVIACPCALVISTPVSIVAALAAAARNGVLVKAGAYIEAPARLDAIAFDKTGTLTRGEPEVVEVVPLGDHSEQELLERAAALEARSEHPLAEAILRYANEGGVEIRPAADVQSIPGKGVAGRHAGELFWLGSHRYLEERGQETPAVHDRLEAMSSAGRTVVVVGNDDHVCGLFAISDGLRAEALEALTELRRLGIEQQVMLTGDNEGTARAIAAELGLAEVRAELLPADKVEAVERLVATGGDVAMIGDGVNDAPAMARATLGIAMGSAGTDAAIESADIALMSDDLRKLPWLVHHSRRTLRVVRQNIAFALGVKVVVFLLASLGMATLWMAIAADMGASLLVIGNGLRLLQRTPRTSLPLTTHR